jgi:hypothetical protein
MSAHDLTNDVLEQPGGPVYMQYMLPPITLCCTVQSTCSTCYHLSHYVALSSLHAVNVTTHHIMLHCPVYMQYMLPPITLCCSVQSTCSTCYHPPHYVALTSLMHYMLPPITLCCTILSTCSTCYHPSHYVALSSLHAVHSTTHHIMLHCPV